MAFLKRGSGNVFLQVSPTEAYEYMTSTGMGDVSIPKRPRTPIYDPDVKNVGEFVATDFIRGEPGEITAPLTRPLDTVQNYLQELDCTVNARINYACRGTRSIVWNYELAILLLGAEFESGNIGQPVITSPGEEDRVGTGGDLKALAWTYLYLLTSKDKTLDDTSYDINAVWFIPEACQTRCGDRVKLGEFGYLVRSPGYLTGGQVMKTEDEGDTWAVTDADPFSSGEDALDVITVDIGDGHRVIVTADAEVGTHAEVSYSDDEGVSWTDVVVSGSAVNEALNSIFQDERGRLYVCSDQGDVYYSDDLGESWTLATSDETAESLNRIIFYDKHNGMAVGDNNAVIITEDGGDTWAAITGPEVGVNITDADYNRFDHIYVTLANGKIYRTTNLGTSWTEVKDMGEGEFTSIRFDEDVRYVGYADYNDASGVGSVYRSSDGGVTWRAETTDPAVNTGLNGLFVCDANMLYAVGAAGVVSRFGRSG